MTPYENLARAIVTQAIADYIPYYTALEKYRAMDTSLFDKETLKKYNKDLAKLERDFDELVDFFYSPWFAQLTDLNPQLILDKLGKEIDRRDSERIHRSNIKA
jgi:hypothetical protein